MPVMTVYIAERGTSLLSGGTSAAGHMWYSISSDGIEKPLSFGFASAVHGMPGGQGQVFRNDVDNYESYAYTKSIYVTQAQYDALKSFGENPASRGFDATEYNWGVNSCVDFTYKALSIVSDTLGGYEGNVIPSWNIQDQKLRAVIQDLEIRNAVDPVPGPSQGDSGSVQAVTVSVDKNAAESLLGHPFDPNDVADVKDVSDGISAGVLTAAIDYVPGQGDGRYSLVSDSAAQNKIVMSAGQSDNAILIVENGQTKLLLLNNNDGSSRETQFDPENTHPYDELDITEDAAGNVTSAGMKFGGQAGDADFSAVGQVFGSALGRALAPNNQFVQLAVGTVAGAAGQKLAQAFAASLSTNGPAVDLTTVFAGFNINLAGAGASSVASFLIAELGTSLHLDGFGASLFNAGFGGFTGSVASQIATKMSSTGASFNVALAGVNFADAATSAGYGISSAFGSYLAHELVPAQTHEGAVAGQLFGAAGSVVGISLAMTALLGGVLDFLLPGVGSLIGTIIGTLLGDQLGSHPHPAAVDTIDQAGDHYGFNHSQVSASDGGDYTIPDPMARAVDSIVNAYFSMVHGAVLDHSKQTMVGYVTDPDFRYIAGWAPTHHYYSFIHSDDGRACRGAPEFRLLQSGRGDKEFRCVLNERCRAAGNLM